MGTDGMRGNKRSFGHAASPEALEAHAARPPKGHADLKKRRTGKRERTKGGPR